MTRQPVTSSQIASIGHNPQTLELDIEFKAFDKTKPNSVYRYKNVTAADHAAIIGAESIGKEVNERIKKQPAKYPYRKLTPEEAAK